MGNPESNLAETINNGIVNLFGGPEQMVETIQNIVRNARAFVSMIPDVEQRYDTATTNVFEGLLAYSWYFDNKMGSAIFFELSELVQVKDEQEIDKMMADHFRARLRDVENDLGVSYPTRARHIADAFEAHRQRLYTLSIPVFFSLADGLSKELMGKEFFLWKKSRLSAQKLMRDVKGDSFLERWVRSLVTKGSVRENTAVMKKGALNRHAVMHGSDTDYDTETNSLKALSLLYFIHTTLELWREHTASGTCSNVGALSE